MRRRSKSSRTTRIIPAAWRIRCGKLLDRLGQLGLPLGLGLVIGYWVSDVGVAWMPTMLEVLSVYLVGALLLILIGQWLKGKLVRAADEGGGIRKRTVTLLVLALLAAGFRLAVFWAEQPTPLTSRDSATLLESFALDTRQYLELDREMERLLRRIEASELFAPNRPRQPLKPADESLLRDSWAALYAGAFALDQLRIFYEDWYRFDLSRHQRDLLVRSYLLTFAAELALYEKSLRFTRLVLRNPESEKFLDAPHPDLDLPEHTFSRFRQEFQGTRDQARVVAGAQYLRWLDETFHARRLVRQWGLERLWQSVETHLSTIHGVAPLERATQTVRADLQLVKRTVRRTWFPAQKRVAEWMGEVKTRRIGQYLISPEQLAAAELELEPGDVLLSRKNWYLSNVGLPGFWPHAILYVGNPEKLSRHFDTAEVRSYLATIAGEELSLPEYLRRAHPAAWARYQAGLHGEPIVVIEAIGEGVILNSLWEAVGDYLVALRPRLDAVAKVQAIIEAFAHLDKPYDFDFDFATDHALVCTELVWRSYRPADGKEGLELPLVKVAGRLTLPANEIARVYAEEYGSPEAQFDFVYFLDGRERELKAVVGSEEAFRGSHQRFKWDIFQR
ncbi:MAG: hypothetical protein GY856_00280 [bacterium]|nr:hypothetical protein [bacterium]